MPRSPSKSPQKKQRRSLSPKQQRSDNEGSDDDSYGPMPPSMELPVEEKSASQDEDLHQVDIIDNSHDTVDLPLNRVLLESLPTSEHYERSYMHRDIITHVAVTKSHFVITASQDGHLKFWRKTIDGIEFVKHFKAHLSPCTHLAVSDDGTLLASLSADKTCKIFDIINFDMINMISLSFIPQTAVWCYERGALEMTLAISSADSFSILLFDSKSMESEPRLEVTSVHHQPVMHMVYVQKHSCIISVDSRGLIEYWKPESPFGLPDSLLFAFKSDTDLYAFAKAKTQVTSLSLSSNGSAFVACGMDRMIRVFDVSSGKLTHTFSEPVSSVIEQHKQHPIFDDMELGRRLAFERELESSMMFQRINAIFDESGRFLIYPTMAGIKFVNLQTGKVERVLGQSENQRFIYLALYQGAPKQKGFMTLDMATSDNQALKDLKMVDPTLFALAFKRNRFFMFTKREPEITDKESNKNEDDSIQQRDVFNEKIIHEDQVAASSVSAKQKPLQNSMVVMHTDMGDIVIKLLPHVAPKAVENFVTHSKSGYYNNVIFHRVIKGFMIQTGDPLGTGTGGESIWGHEFEDEFAPNVRHDRPYCVSMANAGPGTNGSQFFITCVPCPWLDNKHTIFGHVTAGMDIVHAIERTPVDDYDKPVQNINVVNMEVRQ